jgi:hypothetical protein
MTAKKQKPAAPPAPQGNERFLVLDYTIAGDPAQQISALRRRVYLLPPGEHFEGFGGSKSGLDTGKTPSLIVRDSTRRGSHDFESELASPQAWSAIVDGFLASIEQVEAGKTADLKVALRTIVATLAPEHRPENAADLAREIAQKALEPKSAQEDAG